MDDVGFGRKVPRKEDLRLLTGRGAFIDDRELPGQAHAVVLRSPHAHARIRSLDAAAASAAPGVLAVFTGSDLAADGTGGVPCDFLPPEFPGARFRPPGLIRPPYPALARERVRFAGEGVALVIAELPAAARDAAELVAVDYEILPAVVATAGANSPGAPQVQDEAPANRCFVWEVGDRAAVEAAFAAAHRIVAVELVNNRVASAALETRGALGAYDAASGRFTLYAATQMPHGLRQALARHVFRLPEDRIRVVVGDVGGSFGAKNALYPEQILVLWAARRLGRPVKWMPERAESFLADYQCRDNVTLGELALDPAGRFLGLRVRTTANLGAYLAPAGPLSPTANIPAIAGGYRTPAIHVTVTGVFTHTAPTDVYRGAGRPEAIHLLERLIDKAAEDCGVDRAELRRRNLVTPAEFPFATPLGLVYDSGEFGAVLDAALARAGAGFADRRAAALRRGRLRGLGFAHYVERVAGGWPETAAIELDGDGIATAYLATMSNGQGHETAYAQIVAERLGIAIDDVRIVQGDTDRIAPGHGTGGSSSLGIAGAALSLALVRLVERARAQAAEILETAPDDIAFAAGMFTIVGTDRRISLREVARAAAEAAPSAPGAPGLSETAIFRPQSPTFPNGCHVCEVEIDPETGKLEIVDYRMLHDFGRVLNPLLLEGQLHGGVAQGLGQAALEQVVYEPGAGQLLSGSLMDYCLPRADDLPPFELVTRATAAPSNPIGVKGCGEAGAAGAPPALMNAVMDALRPSGVHDLDMPATSERIWRAIREAAPPRSAPPPAAAR